MSSSPSTTESKSRRLSARRALLAVSFSLLGACASSGAEDREGSVADEIRNGNIAYPFVDETESLGREREDQDKERFIIRSAVGDHEYSVEIPGAARDFDVQVPLGDLGEKDPDVLNGKKPKSLGSPVG